MFAVYSCCKPFRRFQLFPPDLSKFREKWTAWTARQTGFHTTPRATAIQNICPCSVIEL